MTTRKTLEQHGGSRLSRKFPKELLADALRCTPNVPTAVLDLRRKLEEIHCYPHESGITYIKQDAGESLLD